MSSSTVPSLRQARKRASNRTNRAAAGNAKAMVTAAVLEALEKRAYLSSSVPISFAAQATYGVGVGPTSVASADLTTGSTPAVVTANDNGTVSILLANSDGALQPATTISDGLSNGPASVSLVALTDDGNADIVVSANAQFSVLLGNGDGTFKSPSVTTTSATVTSIVTDVNGDGKPDLVEVNTNGTVSTFLGNGDGTFGAPSITTTGYNFGLTAVVAGNFGNGHTDLAVTDGPASTVLILLGNGNGTFAVNTTDYLVGNDPLALASADINNDGIADLVAASNNGTVGVLIGNGDGSFKTPTVLTLSGNLDSVAVADLNKDGKADIVAADSAAAGQITVWQGNGDGTFATPISVSVGNHPSSVAINDLNGDGFPDVVVANQYSANVSVLLNNADVVFAPPTTVAVGNFPDFVTSADLNGDGKADLIVSNYDSNTVEVLLGNGNGTFAAPEIYSINHPTAIVVADVNNDGKLDLVVASPSEHEVDVLLGNGDGTFGAPIVTPVLSGGISYGPNSIAVGDLNGDGKDDLVIANGRNGTISVLDGNGDGTFGATNTYDLYTAVVPDEGPESESGANAYAVAVADLNGDRHPDVVVTDTYQNLVDVFLNNGDGTLNTPSVYPVGNYPTSIAVADLNGDNKPDLVTANKYSGTVSVLLGNGDGTFAPQTQFPAGAYPFQVIVTDFNQDSKPDLITANPGYRGETTTVLDSLHVLLGNGDGTFGPAHTVTVGNYPLSVVAADLNGDGFPDLVSANADDNDLSILISQADGTPSISLSDGTLTISGTAGNDTASITYSGGDVVVTIDGLTQSFAIDSVKDMSVGLGAGNDSIVIGTDLPPSTVRGGSGNDTINGGGPGSVLLGNAGDDIIAPGSANITVRGGAGNDTISGNGGDSLRGGPGDDIFVNGSGSGDTVDGGIGLNFAQYNPNDLITNIYQLFGVPASVGNPPGAPTANPAAVSSLAQTLSPSDGTSVTASIVGTRLKVFGGTGDDSISVSSDGTNLTVDSGATSIGSFPQSGLTGIRINGGAGNDTINVESSVTLSATVLGGSGDDSLSGGGGDNVLIGGAGNDTLVGGDGIGATNYLVPGSRLAFTNQSTGNDSLVGGSGGGTNIADFSRRTDNLFLSNDGRPDSGDAALSETITLAANINYIAGGAGNNTLVGTTGGDVLNGDGSNSGGNSVHGGGMGDILIGGLGKDTVVVAAEPVSLFLANGKRDVYSGVNDPAIDILKLDSKDTLLS